MSEKKSENIAVLTKEVEKLKKLLLETKLSKALGNPKQPHNPKFLRKDIARVLSRIKLLKKESDSNLISYDTSTNKE